MNFWSFWIVGRGSRGANGVFYPCHPHAILGEFRNDRQSHTTDLLTS
jgi:hypothetical protein